MRKYIENIVPDFFKNWTNPNAVDHERSVLYAGNKIFSYKTCIGAMDWASGKPVLFLNKKKYSATTSTLQNALRNYADYYSVQVVEVEPDDSALSGRIGIVNNF